MTNIQSMAKCLVLVVAFVAGCRQGDDSANIVQFGSTKAGLFGIPNEYRALHPRLEELFGSRIMFRAQPNGEALAQQLAQGNISYAFMSATEYCSAKDTSGLTPIAVGLNALGKSSRTAYVVVKAKSHVKTIADCAGKRFAFGIYKDLLTDIAAQAALAQAGVPVKKLLRELLLPPYAQEGRLYRGRDVARTIVVDLTVNAGVVDELDYEKMPDTGGNFILGPSKDQLEIVGRTIRVPEMVVVAGPAASPEALQKLKAFLMNSIASDKLVCEQLGVTGFAEPDPAAYEPARRLLASKK